MSQEQKDLLYEWQKGEEIEVRRYGTKYLWIINKRKDGKPYRGRNLRKDVNRFLRATLVRKLSSKEAKTLLRGEEGFDAREGHTECKFVKYGPFLAENKAENDMQEKLKELQKIGREIYGLGHEQQIYFNKRYVRLAQGYSWSWSQKNLFLRDL